MLKHGDRDCHLQTYDPAAFRRLCVETLHAAHFNRMVNQPPSGGCVLKQFHFYPLKIVKYPAAFRRLCVETTSKSRLLWFPRPAAFRRLCVETVSTTCLRLGFSPSRLQAAVC